jgi:AraC family transcriptional regulator
MISTERYIDPHSHYYLNSPSATAQKLLLYPTIIGRFSYQTGYLLKRSRFDSFLIMLIESGTCTLIIDGREVQAPKGSIVLLDCYAPHEYRADEPWTALWMHFDGLGARTYYEELSHRFGNIMVPKNLPGIHYELDSILKDFETRSDVDESVESIRINIILLYLLSVDKAEETESISGIRHAMIYIRDHFSEPIQLQDLAAVASLSPYYFSRLFVKETGVTPHRYLISMRISAAKYLLTASNLSVKEIAFQSGFKDESSFCSAFKKYEGSTPSEYRSTI